MRCDMQGWRQLRASPCSELSGESAAARRVVRLLYRVPLRVLNAIRAFIGEGQCDKGRGWEISAAFEWRRVWGDFIPHLEPGQAAYVEVGLEPGEAA
jgi:hypothetical protein